jgi:type I restriction enzyme S subunit
MSTATTHIKTDKQLVPALRFKEFAGDATQHLFEDIFLFSSGKNIKQAEASPEFETPCVRYGELYHMYGEVINEVINKTNLETSELLFSKGDEILLPSAGEDPLDIGSASALTIENVAIGRTINILRPQEENVYSQIFVSYYISENLRKKISTLARGASISNVYNSDLKKLKINLPSLPEQQKIASFLSAVDEKIQQLSKKKALLEQYKKGGLQQLFSGQLRFKDEEGKEYPDWEEKRLGDICESIKSGKSKSSEDGVIPLYGSTGIIGKCSESSHQGEFILIARVGANAGAINLIDDNFGVSDNTLVVDCKPILVITYIYYFLDHYNLNRLIFGSGQPLITGGLLKALKLDLPMLEEQQKIARYLSSIDTKIESVNKQITQNQTFKKGLLQQMFV